MEANNENMERLKKLNEILTEGKADPSIIWEVLKEISEE